MLYTEWGQWESRVKWTSGPRVWEPCSTRLLDCIHTAYDSGGVMSSYCAKLLAVVWNKLQNYAENFVSTSRQVDFLQFSRHSLKRRKALPHTLWPALLNTRNTHKKKRKNNFFPFFRLNGIFPLNFINVQYSIRTPIPVAALSKVWAYGRSLAGIVGSNPAGGMDVCLFWVLCFVR